MKMVDDFFNTKPHRFSIKRTIEIVANHYKSIFIVALVIWGLTGIVYGMLGREYETQYFVECNDPSNKILLESYDSKMEAINNSSLKEANAWYAGRMRVYTTQRRNVFRITVRGENPAEVVNLAHSFFLAQQASVDKINLAKLEVLVPLQQEIDQAKSKVLNSSSENKELALVEYNAIQTAFYMEKTNIRKEFISLIQVESPMSGGDGVSHASTVKLAFPNKVIFSVGAIVLSIISSILIIIIKLADCKAKCDVSCKKT